MEFLIMAFNLVVLTGRLTAAPELKITPNGKNVCSFTIAVDRSYGNNKETDFITCVAWEKTAEFIKKYFGKGSEIGIEGSIQTRKWTDKNGNNRTAFEIRVSNTQFIGSKKTETQEDPLMQFAQTNPEFVEVGTVNDSDLPF
jgi:single-strand DNA-binding protein